MSEYFFGLHDGHLTAKAQTIARYYGADHINYTEPGTGRRRGWFACPNRGAPFDQAVQREVMVHIERAGGLSTLKHKRDKRNTD